ncbi:hypothetical protein GWK47_019224 [Chionoecetes opilio]|uniref:Uncharacterized protein n=1 Tax=Chionoecetes opilio TaxID=41210 RepID=A0A8J4XQM3_CHIOP|nr:hypothetical protein GWK47_019224 [Chionoecetes opilio]
MQKCIMKAMQRGKHLHQVSCLLGDALGATVRTLMCPHPFASSSFADQNKRPTCMFFRKQKGMILQSRCPPSSTSLSEYSGSRPAGSGHHQPPARQVSSSGIGHRTLLLPAVERLLLSQCFLVSRCFFLSSSFCLFSAFNLRSDIGLLILVKNAARTLFRPFPYDGGLAFRETS